MFQSTRPRRGAMVIPSGMSSTRTRFNPRAPGGARSPVQHQPNLIEWVSIHAPPEGRDVIAGEDTHLVTWFQSTRPRRGAIVVG